MRSLRRLLAATAVGAVCLTGCTAESPSAQPVGGDAPPTAGSTGRSPDPAASEDTPTGGAPTGPQATGRAVELDEREPPPRPVSVLGLAAQRHRGDRLRLGAVRERTAAYTSYDVSFRSRASTARGEESHRITGVLNVPRGRGDFPAVVLAHGYIDPAIYVRGQGMTRERGYLAGRGFIALHVDYRNHAGSDAAPDAAVRMRLGYTSDVINAVKALRASPDVPVDPDRVGLFGRSMGGGVVLKALIAEPGLVQAASLWASVSSLEQQNFEEFIRPDPEDAGLRTQLARRYGLPAENPAFWRENSSRPYFDRITEPVLMVHGRFDDTCPPRWATATHQALGRAGVDSQLEWYADGHAFGPAFFAAMNRTARFFDRRLG